MRILYNVDKTVQKKILILDTGKEWGGGTNSLLELLKRIDKGRYHFSAVFYANYTRGAGVDIKAELENLGIDFSLLMQRELPVRAKMLKELIRGVFFFSRSLKRYGVFFVDYYFRIKQTSDKLLKIIRNINADALYLNNQPSSNLEGLLAAQHAAIPVIQHARSNASLLPIETRIANRAITSMICVSAGLKSNYITQGIQERITTVVYNGIDIARKPGRAREVILNELGIKNNEVLVGMVGSLLKRKRFDIFIRALKDLKDADTQFKGVIVGDGPENESLRQMVNHLGLKGEVVFTGFKADGLSYINVLDILVLSSLEEGFPRVILEAMLMEKPVVVSDIPGPSELVIHNETGYLVPAGRPDAFAGFLRRLLERPGLRAQMGKKGRERVVEQFSIERYVHGVSKVFEEVLG